MNRSKITWLFCATLLLVASCKRDTPQTDGGATSTNPSAVVIEAKDLVVPANFNFSSEKTLNVRVKVADAKTGERYAIRIYSDVPSTGKLISTGATNTNGEYANIIRIPAWEEFIYIEKINPDGSSQFEKVKANQFASAVFNGGQTNTPYIITKKSSGMDCSTGCTVTYNNPTSNITVGSGQIACITGTISSTITINVNNGGVAKICAGGNLYELYVHTGGKAYILENAILKIDELFVLGGELETWSDSLLVGIDFDVNYSGSAINHGNLYSGVKVFSGSEFTNNGSMIIPTSLSASVIFAWEDATFTNNNYIKSPSGLGIYDNSTFINNCYAEFSSVDNTSFLVNNSYLKVTDTYLQELWGSPYPDAVTTLHDGAMISTKNLSLSQSDVKGTGSVRNKFKVSNNTSIASGSSFTGTLDLCDANGIETNNGTIQSPALASCAGYIPTSTCNPEGFGSFSTADTDNDGVADSQDEYPNDATRAFTSYYPNASTTATLAFEDLWPALADYDFNDLVLAFNIQQVYNADNKVVDIKLKMKVKAIGGSYVNGFGIQLDELVPANIASITGQILTQNLITRNANNTEAGQSKAVIICYDSPEPTLHRMGGSMFNTIKTNPLYASDSIYINIALSTPVDGAKLSIDKFNPFIFTNKRRGYEIHLGNFKPTDLANTALFGTYVDRTNPSSNIYYKNSNGMPWAILIPENFVYPTEKTPITSGYNFFDDWAISGGTGYSSWYMNNPGNRNPSYLY